MDDRIIEALKPTLGNHVLVTQAREYPNGNAPYKFPPMIKETLALARGSITRAVHYNTNTTYNHMAVYGWDVDEERFVLLEYVAQGTHKDDLPWRKKKGK